MRRHLPRLLLTGALLSPASLYALGLGEIRLNSSLNQPFDADIELIAPTAEELASLKIGLASNDLFSRYGLDRPAYLSGFDFAVTRRRDGNASVKVTSNRSVTEPFVTLLVEASWGRGRLLREYTVLLDPPAFLPSQPETQAPVAAPQSGARNDGRIERPAPPQPTRTVPAPARETPTEENLPSPVGATGAYAVERNDTLWRIAAKVKPDSSPRVINQTMIALFRANPEAFGGNINRLRAGAILRIPDSTDIEAISTSEATAEVARQQDAWNGANAGTPTDESSRLRLVTPAETPPAPTVTPAPAVEAPRPATPPKPAPATSAQGTPDKRLEVTDPSLAAVQRNATQTPPAAAPVEQPPAAEEVPPAPVAEQPPAESVPVAPAAATPAPAPGEEGPSILSRLGDFWWVFVVLGLLVVALLAVLKRRRDDSADSIEALDLPDYEPPVTRVQGSKGRAEPFAALDEDDIDNETRPDFDLPDAVTRRADNNTRIRPIAPVDEPAPALSRVDDTLSSDSAVRFDQQDALAEADFHMAYGLYDQAADLVKIAIDREPDRRDLKLKLLEIYFVWGNRDLFLDTARDLHRSRASATLAEWDKVVIMGKQIAPEDPIFKDEGTSHVDLVDVNLEGGENRVDVDLFAEPESQQPSGLDLEFGSGERATNTGYSTGAFKIDATSDRNPRIVEEEPTREMNPLARTQETPTIESPKYDRGSQTIREKVKVDKQPSRADQTAELSLDDLGLDVDALEATGSLEETTALSRSNDEGATRISRPIRDDEMTQLAPSLTSFDRTMEAPRPDRFDIDSTGTIYIDQVDLASGDTREQVRSDNLRSDDLDSTASLQRLPAENVDVDLSEFGPLEDDKELDTKYRTDDTLSHALDRDSIDRFSKDVFADEGTSRFGKIDMDVGDALGSDDGAPTNRQVLTTEMELSELEPVTMSEVGTKLDLARAYMDMGDPDGARSILEEVVQEGTSNQKQEAQRLLDSIR
ncbi:MAG: FimV/HubP family polar landmark protein [Steroidobacteraceae bacterium]